MRSGDYFCGHGMFLRILLSCDNCSVSHDVSLLYMQTAASCDELWVWQ